MSSTFSPMPMMAKCSSFWLELAWGEASLSTTALWVPPGGVLCGVGVPASLTVCEDGPRVSVTTVEGSKRQRWPYCVAAERAGSGSCDGVGVGEACFALELERSHRVNTSVPLCGVLGGNVPAGWDVGLCKSSFSPVASGSARTSAVGWRLLCQERR